MIGSAVIRFPWQASADDSDEDARIRAALRGDARAFETLYRSHVARVFGLLKRLCGGQEALAEELVQEAFIKAWQSLPSFRFESRFGTWLHRLAANVGLMELRRRRGGEDREDAVEDLEFAHLVRNDNAGLRSDLEAAVRALPNRAREVLILFDVEGFTHEEIAQMTGVAVGTCKAQLHRARKLLREAMGEESGHA